MKKSLSNSKIAQILSELGMFYDMQEIAFKPRAYEKAAEGIDSLDEAVTQIYKDKGSKGLLQIPGVGRGIAEHLGELASTGRLKIYEEFKKKMPVELSELVSVEGVGPKKVKALYEKLKVKNLGDLERAAKSGKIANLAGFGQKSQEQILAGLKFTKQDKQRYLLGEVFPKVAKLEQKLLNSKYFQNVLVSGSFRRRQEIVGDIDILATARNPQEAMDFFVNSDDAVQVLEHGKTKSEIRLDDGIQVDLRVVPEESWGAAAQYFTGDLAHNIKMRKIAIAKGLKLNEYGLTPVNPPLRGGKGREVVVTATEEQVYKALGMDYIPPELRQDTGEIEAAKQHKLPKLLEYGSLKGDLQVQTNWTDGKNSIEEMADAANQAGLHYIAITDHTKTLAMTGGLDEKKLLQQMKEIDRLNTRSKFQVSGFRILKGAEVNILKDGLLDIADEVLVKLDVVGVSIHTNMKMDAKNMTKRIIRALSNPNVDIFFHPTTRLVNRRPPIQFDFDGILKAAKKNHVALEINSLPERLDIHDTLIRKAVDAGVKLVINSDAHHVKHFQYLHLGVAQARRGWAQTQNVLNTHGIEKFLEALRKK